MGCDIHVYIEIYEDKRWEMSTAALFKSQYYRAGDNKFGLAQFSIQPQVPRNYGLFATLAGVRNYDAVEPICSPRGLPDDVSRGVLAQSDDDGVDGHSHSYFKIKELLAYAEETKKEASEFNITMLPIIKKIRKTFSYYNENQIRLVFWFDN